MLRTIKSSISESNKSGFLVHQTKITFKKKSKQTHGLDGVNIAYQTFIFVHAQKRITSLKIFLYILSHLLYSTLDCCSFLYHKQCNTVLCKQLISTIRDQTSKR